MEIKLLGPVVPVGSNLGVAVKWNMNMLPASCLPEVLGTLGKMELLEILWHARFTIEPGPTTHLVIQCCRKMQ